MPQNDNICSNHVELIDGRMPKDALNGVYLEYHVYDDDYDDMVYQRDVIVYYDGEIYPFSYAVVVTPDPSWAENLYNDVVRSVDDQIGQVGNARYMPTTDLPYDEVIAMYYAPQTTLEDNEL